MAQKNTPNLTGRSKEKKRSTIKLSEEEQKSKDQFASLDIPWSVQLARSAPAKLDSISMLALQRTIGNEAVTRIVGVSGPTLQKEGRTSTDISETTDTGNKYTQELVLNKKKAYLFVYLGVNWKKEGTWASDAAFKKFTKRVKNAFLSYADRKFKVVCTPKAKGAGKSPVELPISFLIYDYEKGYDIEAHGGKPGDDSFMTQSGGEVYEYDGDDDPEADITYAHEFGHAMLGVSDEYANPKVAGRVLTNDHSIMANYYAQGIDKAEFKARHFQHIAKEVAKAFAGYTCKIKKM